MISVRNSLAVGANLGRRLQRRSFLFLYKKWKTLKQIESDDWRDEIEFVANEYCPIINTLPESSFMKYVK